MSETGSRVRKSVIPIPKTGPLTYGRFKHRTYSWNGSQLTFLPWVNTSVNTTFFPSEKFVRAKVTVDQKNPGPPYRSGGRFFSRTYINEYNPSDVLGKGTYYAFQFIPETGKREVLRQYVGGFQSPGDATFQWDTIPIGTLLDSSVGAQPDLSDWGDKAFNKMKPKLQKASGFVFVAELRDVPKMLEHAAHKFHLEWGHVLSSGKFNKNLSRNRANWRMVPEGAANDFLAFQFGWAPFIGDIFNLHKVVDNYASYVERLSRDNGKSIRRRVTLDETHTEQVIASGSGLPAQFLHSSNGESDWFSSTPSWSLTEEIKSHTYAVGKFKYYLPELDKGMADYVSQWKKIKRFMLLFGLRVSPSNLYKSIPWTWLIDWVTRFGDLVDHFTDAYLDSVVCEYLYVMQHSVVKRTYTRVFPFRTGTVTCSWSRVIETKSRLPAGSPYGFSLSVSDLTPRQIGILGALGISRRWI